MPTCLIAEHNVNNVSSRNLIVGRTETCTKPVTCITSRCEDAEMAVRARKGTSSPMWCIAADNALPRSFLPEHRGRKAVSCTLTGQDLVHAISSSFASFYRVARSALEGWSHVRGQSSCRNAAWCLRDQARVEHTMSADSKSR